MSKDWQVLQEKLGGVPYFGNVDVAQILGKEEAQVKQILYRYLKARKIMRIKRGAYMMREFFLVHKLNFDFAGMVASVIAPRGYLSTEYILHNHGVMTEAVMAYTGVTLGKTQRISSQLGSYIFRNMKPDLYGGYKKKLAWGVEIREASLGKALFDFLYLRPHGWTYGASNYDLVEDLRLNLFDWNEKDKNEFAMWVEKSESKKMKNALNNIKEHLWG